MPKVTVGVPTYNRADHLRNALVQILAQDYRDLELIVSDDASTDSTPEIVRQFNDDRLIYSRNESNLRIPGNLNAILSRARGDYIVFLHDHDSFHPSLVSRMVRVLDTNVDVGLVFSGLAWTDHLGLGYRVLLEDFPELIPKRELVRHMLESRDFSCPVNADHKNVHGLPTSDESVGLWHTTNAILAQDAGSRPPSTLSTTLCTAV